MLISKYGGDDILEKIEMYEDVIGRDIPEKLRNFLKKYNGGDTPKTKFWCNHVSSDIKAFYGLGRVRYSYDDVKILQFEGCSYLPFGCDSFGNEIVMEMDSEEIYFKDHEAGNVRKISDTLENFIDSCESDLINSSSLKSVEERENELIKKGRASVITDALRDMWKAEIEKYSSIKQEELIL